MDSTAPAEAAETSRPLAGRTAWARNLEAPLREFLRTQTGSAAILAAGEHRRRVL
jgi:hypothetical protein